jgi:kynurenine formamidase
MTTINKIEVLEDGVLQVRLNKTAKPGHEAKKENWGNHRGAAEPGADIDAMRIIFNEHFAAMGVEDISTDEWQKVKDHAAIAHTDAVIAAYAAAHPPPDA